MVPVKPIHGCAPAAAASALAAVGTSSFFKKFNRLYGLPAHSGRGHAANSELATVCFFETFRRCAFCGNALFTVSSYEKTFNKTGVSPDQYRKILGQLQLSGLVDKLEAGRWSARPGQGVQAIYQLTEAGRRLFMFPDKLNQDLAHIIIRDSWDGLGVAGQAAFMSRNPTNGERAPSAWKLSYKRSAEFKQGAPVLDTEKVQQLFRLNTWSRTINVTIAGQPLMLGELANKCGTNDEDNDGMPIEDANTGEQHVAGPSDYTYSRIFTDDLQHHGRLYAPVQNVPGVRRKLFEIDGERCVEIDFKALHPSILFCEAHLPLPADIYTSLDLATDWATLKKNNPKRYALKRAKIKRAILIGINAATDKSACQALSNNHRVRDARKTAAGVIIPARLFSEDYPFLSFEDVKSTFSVVKAHPLLGKFLGCRMGNRLMYIDSSIILAAADQLLLRKIHFILIHDSIIVPRIHAELTKAIMLGAFTAVTGGTTEVEEK